jgi:hypothetical protein
MDVLQHRFHALTTYIIPPLHHISFEPGLNWWLISPSENLREQAKGSLHVLVHLRFNEDDEMVNKIKLSNMIERKFSDKFRIVQFN